MENKNYDVVIIGGGPIGMACAIEAKRNGLSHVVLEKGTLVNSVYHFPVNMTFFSTSQLLEIGDVPFIAHSDKPTRREALEYFRRVAESWELNINVYTKVNNISGNAHSGFNVTTTKGLFRGKYIITATGFYDTPNLLNIPGEELDKVKHYYDEPHPYIGQKIAVIGAGNSAADVALECYLKGAEVTMLVREDALKPSIKYWILPNLKNRIKEGNIKAQFNSELTQITQDAVFYNQNGREYKLENDFVLAMTGYRPNYPFLKKLGIGYNNAAMVPEHNTSTLESNVENIYLAGVVLGGLNTGRWFIENAREHAEKICNSIKGKRV